MPYILIPTLIYAALHFYLWRTVVSDLRLPRPAAVAATLAFVVLSATPPLAIYVGFKVSRVASPVLTAVGFGWISFIAYLTAFLVLADAVRLIRGLVRRVRAPGRTTGTLVATDTPEHASDRAPFAPTDSTNLPPEHAGDRATTRSATLPPERDDSHAPVAPTGNTIVPPERATSATTDSTVPPERASERARSATTDGAPLPTERALNALTGGPAAGFATSRETRRLFVKRAVVGSALAASSGIIGFGVRSAVWDITTPEIAIRLSRFPRALDGYKIALLSDVHIGPMLARRFLRHLVEQTNRLQPDMIAIGGDLVDGRVHEIGSQIEELRHLRARDGVFFVTGNHEYYSGARQWLPFLSRLGIRVLLNEHVSVGDRAPDGARFDLAGVADHKHQPDARAATLGRDVERELVMLAHQPVQIAESVDVGAGLQLSGHTHGGQMLPFGAIALLDQPYLAGLHRHGSSDTQIYVSRGSGFWGPPIRVLAPAEIALLRLHA